jgi:uncharacterized protein YgiM (DUF1202 family)
MSKINSRAFAILQFQIFIMKQMIILLLTLIFSASLSAQTVTRYIAVRAGMSIREKPDAKAKVLEKIPYSEKLTVNFYSDSVIDITTEGITGKWVKVMYKGKTGYVVSSYLFPSPPPKQGVNTLKAYLAQISTVAGPAVTRRDLKG